jgi:transcriptional regulator with XRE-family HTH domain
MNEVQELIAELRGKGWTLAAIADELKVDHDTVYRWQRGLRSPANPVGVLAVLKGLLQRRRVPKRRRYVGKRNPPAT